MNYPQYILSNILNTIFPIRCLGCGLFSPINRKGYLCKQCRNLILIKKDLECIGCGRKSALGKTCFECRDSNSIDNLLIISDYKNPLLQKVLKAFKYRFIPDLAESFIPLFKKYIAWLAKDKNFSIIADDPIIIPIPLHPRRLNWRGFNQAEVVANIVADISQLKIRADIISRFKYSQPQAEIKDKEERLKNLSDKFKLISSQGLNHKTVILVDDICTSGATLNEAAAVLKNNGVKKVIGLVVARG